MRRSILIFQLLIITFIAKAEVSKIINIPTAGSLSTLLTSNDKSTVTNLKIVGHIDASDIKCLRDEITLLADLDLSMSIIEEYNGNNGTCDYTSYPSNELPPNSFYDRLNLKSKTSLQTIIFPNGLISIGDHAFQSCHGLKTITLPSTLNRISGFAFLECIGLTDVIFPQNLKFIGFGAFTDCIGIKNLYFPDSLLSIQMFSFSNCKSLNQLVLPNGLTSLGMSAFSNCSSITGNVIIPEGITSIEESSFINCQLINSLTLPSKLSSIGKMAFKDCSGLKTIYCNNPTPPNLRIDAIVNNDCFTGTTSLTDVYVQDASVYKVNTDWTFYFPGNIIKKNINTENHNNTTKQIKIYTSSQGINIEGLIQGEKIKVYDVNGTKINELISDGERLILTAKRNTLYFLIIGAKTFKVMV